MSVTLGSTDIPFGANPGLNRRIGMWHECQPMTTNHFRQKSFVRAALAALVLVLVPAVASAQSRRGGGGAGSPGHLEVGGEAGFTIPFESGVGVGIKFAPEGFFFLPEFSPGLSLGVGGQLALDYHFGDFNFWFMDIVPMGRLRFAVNPGMSVYGDLGLGIGILHSSGVTVPFLGTVGGGTEAGLLLKLGGGVEFKVSPKLSVTAGPAFNFYVRSGGTTTLSLMGGLLFKL